MKEVWKLIKGFEGIYEVSNLGIVRSVDRKVWHERFQKHVNRKSRVLKASFSTGYAIVTLHKNNVDHYRKIHRLVLESFKPVKNMDKLQVNHIDGEKLNNRLSNLEWCNSYENVQHAKSIGIYDKRGTGNGRSKLSDEDVRNIRSLYKTQKYSQAELGTMFEVSQFVIGNVVRGKSWNHVK